MTYAEVLEKANQIEDVIVCEFGNQTRIELIVKDFEGFDDEWNEIFCDYNEETVDELIEWLEEHAVQVDADFYTTYYFDGFEVCLGYSSYEI